MFLEIEKATYADIAPLQRTARGRSYERYFNNLSTIMRGGTAEDREQAERINSRFFSLMEKPFNVRDAGSMRTKGVNPSAVHSDSFLGNLSVQYANDDYIGTRLMPVVSVSQRSNKFAVYPKRERFAYPPDEIGDRGRASELDESRSFDNYSVVDYGYQNYVDIETLNNQDAPFNEMMDLVQAIAEGIAFREEKRIAAILTTAGNYAGNTTTLSGTSQWDASAGDPVKIIQDAKAALWQGRGPSDVWLFSSIEVYNVLARHQAIRDLFKYVGSGLAMPQAIAGYFGCAGYLVASAREDTANENQTASYSRIWGKHFGMVRVARSPSLRNAFFGATMRLAGDPVSLQWFDPAVGKQGGYYAKQALSEDHKVIAGDTGYLVVNAVS